MRFVALALLFVSLAGASPGCQKDIPIWRGKIYRADHVNERLERTQEGEFIPTSDSRFDDFICIRQKSFDCFTQTYILNSKGWSSQSACGLEQEP